LNDTFEENAERLEKKQGNSGIPRSERQKLDWLTVLYMEGHCYKCLLPFEDPDSIVSVGEDQYHKGCLMELVCTKCNKTIGYLATIMDSSNNRISCTDCSNPWISRHALFIYEKLVTCTHLISRTGHKEWWRKDRSKTYHSCTSNNEILWCIGIHR
jgi:hypothetical protein